MPNVAAIVRKDRELHPEKYFPKCLWQIVTRRGPTVFRIMFANVAVVAFNMVALAVCIAIGWP